MLSLIKPATVAGMMATLMLTAAQAAPPAVGPGSGDALQQSPEVHLSNVRQLTFEGENAEANFSFDGTRLIFQSTPRSGGCDQI